MDGPYTLGNLPEEFADFLAESYVDIWGLWQAPLHAGGVEGLDVCVAFGFVVALVYLAKGSRF